MGYHRGLLSAVLDLDRGYSFQFSNDIIDISVCKKVVVHIRVFKFVKEENNRISIVLTTW